jgi:hypothetical protein
MQKDDGVELKSAMNKLQQLSKTVKDIAALKPTAAAAAATTNRSVQRCRTYAGI